ncbi:hypothetical protein CBS101457_001783 [Exobasidium rhododendri]|nr:hypothetical protein CBS101457_001783 [Exobasidium rhododendri]
MASRVKFPKSEEELEKLKYNPDGSLIEAPKHKFWRKMKEQPLVPIGSLLTCGALIVASHHLRTGNRAQFQKALRWRVGLQGVTVVAAMAGTFYLGSGTPAPNLPNTAEVATVPGRPATILQLQKAEERREAERVQLRERLREAEIKSELEQKRRAEEVLLRPGGEGLRARPVIGKDSRNRSTSGN